MVNPFLPTRKLSPRENGFAPLHAEAGTGLSVPLWTSFMVLFSMFPILKTLGNVCGAFKLF